MCPDPLQNSQWNDQVKLVVFFCIFLHKICLHIQLHISFNLVNLSIYLLLKAVCSNRSCYLSDIYIHFECCFMA